MRFYLFGPRFLGIRAGLSFQPSDLRSHKPPQSAASYVYVVKGEQHVKIGVTKAPDTRLAQLRTGSASPIDYAFLAPASGDPYAIEREAHAMLARSRLNGEWFDVQPELAIAAVTGAAAKLGQSLTDKPKEKPSFKGLFLFLTWLVLTILAVAAIYGFFASPP
jgi:hypothetical protein